MGETAGWSSMILEEVAACTFDLDSQTQVSNAYVL